MPKRAGDVLAEQAEQVLAECERENLETLNEAYQAFAAKVDTRALLAWKLPDGLDDLLLPLFRDAVVAITKDLRLGELTAAAGPSPYRAKVDEAIEELRKARILGRERQFRTRLVEKHYVAARALVMVEQLDREISILDGVLLPEGVAAVREALRDACADAIKWAENVDAKETDRTSLFDRIEAALKATQGADVEDQAFAVRAAVAQHERAKVANGEPTLFEARDDDRAHRLVANRLSEVTLFVESECREVARMVLHTLAADGFVLGRRIRHATESEPPRVEWANRLELRGESEIVPAGPTREGGGEEGARKRMQFPWHTALLKRTVTYGPWVEVPVDSTNGDD